MIPSLIATVFSAWFIQIHLIAATKVATEGVGVPFWIY
jgi:hypothetical protein